MFLNVILKIFKNQIRLNYDSDLFSTNWLVIFHRFWLHSYLISCPTGGIYENSKFISINFTILDLLKCPFKFVFGAFNDIYHNKVRKMSKDIHIFLNHINNALKSYNHDTKDLHLFCHNIYTLFFVNDLFNQEFISAHYHHSNRLFYTIKHTTSEYNVLSLFFLLKKDHKKDRKFWYFQYLC